METTTLVGGQILVGVHSPGVCAGEHCCIHNPSAHHMVEWTQNFREDRGIMERLCEHNVGHPDPDDPSTDTVHGCDGCCSPPIGALSGTPVFQDDDLPGMWCHSDFEGGVDFVRGPDWKPGDPNEPVGYDGFGAPLYAHQVPPEGVE